MKRTRPILELLALGLLVAAVALGVVIVSQGPKVVVAPSSPLAKVTAKAKASPTLKAQAALPCPPPPGEGVVGACTPKPVQVFGTHTGPQVVPVDPARPASVPDVSSWQGIVNWDTVRHWQLSHHYTPAGIFKMGEYVVDPYAARNNAQLASLHMWRAGYWFLRNTGCTHEANQIVSEARALGLRIVFEDDEVPEARGYDGCITPTLKHAGLIVGEYASPGAYPGGARSSNAAWIAAYGPFNPPAAPWGGPITAFQCTDGIFGCVTYVPGIGKGDVSVDLGITRLGSVTSKPDPYAVFLKKKFSFGRDHASEYNTVRTWHASHCTRSSRSRVCATTRYHLVLLRDRLWTVAHRHGKPNWAYAHRGARLQELLRDTR